MNIKNPFYTLSILFSFFYLIMIIHTYSISEITNPGNMLQLSSYLIQGLMIIFMFLGFQAIHQELNNNTYEVFKIIPKSIPIKLFGNIFTILIINLLFCLTSIIIIFFSYKYSGYTDSIFYYKSLLFVFEYWVLPFIISIFFGALYGLLFRKNIGVAAILITCIILSPMNEKFINNFFKMFGFEKIPSFLILGQVYYEMPYNSFSGFYISFPDIINKIMWIILLISLSLGIYFIKSNGYQKVVLICFIPIAYLFIMHIKDYSNENTLSDYHKRYINELNYYAEEKQGKVNSGFDYDIAKYVIDLKTSNTVDATVDIFFQNQIEGEKSFALYHGFKITEIVDQNGNKLNHSQEGDFISVHILNPSISLTFKYIGKSSPYFPVSTNNVYLPFYFAWIPSNTLNAAFKYIYESNYRLPQQPKNNIEYILFYEGASPINTNLAFKDNHYEGISDSGIYIINGELKTIEFDNKIISYPLTWENSMGKLKDYLSIFTHLFEQANNLFDLNISMPDKISFIPVRGANDNYISEFMWYHPNEIFIIVDPYENHDKNTLDILKKRISYDLIGSLLWKRQGLAYDNYEIVTLFNILVGIQLNKNIGIDENQYSIGAFWLKNIYRTINEESTKQIVDKITSFVDVAQDEEKYLFFSKWMEILHNKNANWQDIEVILETIKSEKRE
ncbi:ABC transporter permease [Bacillus ndiopicus]|uniref:hypothetical protein n=1 Tax=Bacillus ndiopicus TaxID=1347368 RepID=UPI0018A82951|nr:hypothetical protein [Bacillus ndiopicus]